MTQTMDNEENLLSDNIYQEYSTSQSPQKKKLTHPYGWHPSKCLAIKAWQTNSPQDDWPLILNFGEAKFTFKTNPPEWVTPLLWAVCELDALQHNWDSYGGLPISLKVAEKAISLLITLQTSSGDPIPSVVPTSNGGIQLEWHEGGVDLEIELSPDTPISLFIDDRGCEEEIASPKMEVIQGKFNILQTCKQRPENVAPGGEW